MKTPVILNLVWAGVAGAAFYTGWKLSPASDSSASGQSKKTNIQAGATPLGAGTGKGVSALLASKDSSVLDFYKRFGLDTGTPLTPEKMKEAMLEAIREGDPVKSQLLFARLMEELTPENAPSVLATIRENVGGFESMRYTGMLAYKWGELDPVNAMKELAKGDDRGGRMSQTIALTGWASKDPQAAIAWLAASKADDREKEWMTNSIITGMARSTDVEGALKYASTLKTEDERSRAAETLAKELIRSGGAEKATAWLNSLSDPDMKRGAFQSVSDQILRGDPAKAAEFVKAYANEDYARDAVRNVADTLARKDVQSGLAFANDLTGKAQAKAIGSVVNQWLDADNGAGAVDAAKYVESLPAGANRDAGARELARQSVRDDPQTAIAWASSIQDVKEKEDTLVDVGRRYMREDPAAAQAWLAQSGLSAEAQQQVTTPDRGGRGGFGGGGFPGGGRPTGVAPGGSGRGNGGAGRGR